MLGLDHGSQAGETLGPTIYRNSFIMVSLCAIAAFFAQFSVLVYNTHIVRKIFPSLRYSHIHYIFENNCTKYLLS